MIIASVSMDVAYTGSHSDDCLCTHRFLARRKYGCPRALGGFKPHDESSTGLSVLVGEPPIRRINGTKEIGSTVFM